METCVTNKIVSEKQKEATAILVMRCMLSSYSKQNKISFEDAVLSFSNSKTYEALFDYDTEIWKEGPDYLMSLYVEENKAL